MQCLLRRAHADPLDAPAVQQLQRLRDELDVADAAGVELDVPAVVVPPVRSLDLVLQALDAGDRGVVHARAVDDRVERMNRAPAEVDVAGDRTRFHERGLRPGVGPALVVHRERFVGDDQRALRALRPQIEIDAVQEAGVGRIRDELTKAARGA